VLGVPVWDINGDGIVNIVDIVIVALAFDSHTGEPKWDPRADIAQSFGVINIVDIVAVAIHFDEVYP
jgi:endoglucanase